jgi:prepilin-type processing-associated H-X9-DG protein
MMLNHYAGISGFAVPQTGQAELDLIGFNETRKVPGQFGMSSSGGLLFVGGSSAIRQVTDGTSNTLMVSEQSGMLIADTGEQLPIGTGIAYGWLIGGSKSSPPRLDHPQSGGDWRAHQCTTVRYTINQKTGWRFLQEFGEPSSNSSVTGVGVIGTNIPINSGHPGGVNCLFADGSVRFLQDSTSLRLLAAISTRDEGQPNLVE